MKTKFLYLAICSLLLAGIVHILIVLLIPYLGSRDAAKQISSSGSLAEFQLVDDGRSVGIADSDPFMKLAVCRFDLSEMALQISGDSIPTFWSASVFDERGRVIYSLNDRTAIKNQLQMIIVNPIQMADIRQSQPEEVESSILVETSVQKGFVLLRALIRDPSWTQQALDFLKRAQCKPFETR